MLVTAALLFALTCWALSLFNFPGKFSFGADRFPFDPVSRTSKIFFGLSFLMFLLQDRRAKGSRNI